MQSFFKHGAAMLLSVGLAVSLVACGPGGSDKQAGSNEPDSVSTDLGDKSYSLTLWDGAGLKTVDDALIKGFTKKYPKIKIKAHYDPDNVTSQNGPRLIASKDAPDIARVTDVNSAVKGKHVISLEPYVQAYGWKVPQSQTQLYRADGAGKVGKGNLYALPNSYSVAGMYVNTKLLKKAGIEKVPTTMDDLESDMAKVKDAGEIPVMINGKDGGISYIFQAMMVNNDSLKTVTDWILQRDGSTFDTKGAKKAAERIQSWSKNGYLPSDVNAVDGSSALNRFANGQGVFFPSGNWNLDQMNDSLGADVQFVPFPSNSADQKPNIAANGGSFFGIPTNSAQKDAAACFLNYTQSDEARQIIADVSGYFPKTVKGQSVPKAKNDLQKSMFDSYLNVFESGNSTDFINNATAGLQASALVPNFQLLVDGSISPSQFTQNVQNEYKQEVMQ